MGEGLLNIGSTPPAVFGKAITSRIEGALQIIAIRRSKPGQSNEQEMERLDSRETYRALFPRVEARRIEAREVILQSQRFLVV